MKMSLRFAASAAGALIMAAACFVRHYTQTNLVSNASGVDPLTDPQLTAVSPELTKGSDQ